MRSCYCIRLSQVNIAIADVCDYFGHGRIITRINVPAEFRGKGHGRDLLAQITRDADKEGVTLWLEISPSDGLDGDQLAAWYIRAGFMPKGIYRRLPNKGSEHYRLERAKGSE
jgi:ribosomal protein S18 acetylase RimI-like enzyme